MVQFLYINIWVYMSKKIENRISERYLHIHVHCSISHNSQEVEAT